MKQIIFTVSARQYGITISTKSLLAEQSDRKIDTVAAGLLYYMRVFTEKYNDKGIAVLFEVD
jgi:hypothetical protein